MAIGRAVLHYARLPMHLVQELNVGTVPGSPGRIRNVLQFHVAANRLFALFQ